MQLKYRADIDGLRAIAVLAVIFFHAGIPGFSGGFVGVDVFFVISGFLITSIILKEIQNGTFSIARFYERRIRRIFPALFPVIAFTLIVGAVIFNFNAFKDLGQSITATTLFSSNILFWYRGGYFDAPSLQKPLLHTWSLAVEEQFYIFFPLLLFAIHRFFRNRYFLWLLGIAFVSLVASIWAVHFYQEATFYWVPTRAWELLAGSLLALEAVPLPSSSVQRNVLSVSGLGLISYSIGFYTEATLFPGANAIAPVLGASLIIYSGIAGTSVVSKALSVKPLVFIGLISYSLYLWHWPLIAFSKYFMFRELNALEITLIIAATFFISVLSLKFIEQPFRGNQPIIPDRKRLFALSAIVMFLAIFSGSIINMQNGMPYRYPEANAAIMRVEERDSEWGRSGELINEKINNSKRRSTIGAVGKVPSFILWGDSHAQALLPAISSKAKQFGLSGFVFSGGPPTLGIDVNGSIYSMASHNDEVMSFIKQHPEVKTVIIAARWPLYANGQGSKNELPLMHNRLKDVNGFYSSQSNAMILRMGLFKAVQTLIGFGKKVVIVSDVPEIGFDVLKLSFLSHIKRESYYGLLPSRQEYYERNKAVQEMLSVLSKRSNVMIVHPELMFFDKNGYAIIAANSKLLYRDDDHLSGYGADFVAPVFDNVFQNISDQAVR